MSIYKKIFCFCTIIAISFTSGCGIHENTSKSLEQTEKSAEAEQNEPEKVIDVNADYITFDYKGLKEQASAILKVQVNDDLTTKNSMTDKDESSGMVTSFCSVRKVKVLDVYKNSKIKKGSILNIQDSSAVLTEDGKILQLNVNGVKPLEKGKKYIVFLGSDKTMSGFPDIISADNGRVNLSAFNNNQNYFDIAVKAVTEFDSQASNKIKSDILEASEIKRIDMKNINETFHADTDLNIGIRKSTNGIVGIAFKQ